MFTTFGDYYKNQPDFLEINKQKPKIIEGLSQTHSLFYFKNVKKLWNKGDFLQTDFEAETKSFNKITTYDNDISNIEIIQGDLTSGTGSRKQRPINHSESCYEVPDSKKNTEVSYYLLFKESGNNITVAKVGLKLENNYPKIQLIEIRYLKNLANFELETIHNQYSKSQTNKIYPTTEKSQSFGIKNLKLKYKKMLPNLDAHMVNKEFTTSVDIKKILYSVLSDDGTKLAISYTTNYNKNYIQIYSKSNYIWYKYGKTISLFCLDGILNEQYDVCCRKSCGKCGGTGCSNLSGGANNCCTTNIRNSKNVCSNEYDSVCTKYENLLNLGEYITSSGTHNFPSSYVGHYGASSFSYNTNPSITVNNRLIRSAIFLFNKESDAKRYIKDGAEILTYGGNRWYTPRTGDIIIPPDDICFTYVTFNKHGNLISTNGNNGELLIYAYNTMNNQWMINTNFNNNKDITHINHNSGYILSKLMLVNNFQNINVSFTDDSKYLISHNYLHGTNPYSDNYTLMNNPIHNENGVYLDGTNQFIKMDPYQFGGDTSFEAYVNLDDNDRHGAKYGHTRIFFFGIDPNKGGTEINGVRQSIQMYVVNGAFRSDGTHNRDQYFYGRLGFTVDMYKDHEGQLRGLSTGKKSDGTYYYESGKPTHIVVTVNSDKVKIYINGDFIKEGQGYNLDNITRKYHYLGSYDERPTTHPATNFARGWFKHFRIWNNKVLDQNDISKLYGNREELTSVLDNVSKQYNFRKPTNFFTDTLELKGTVPYKAKNILFNPNEYVKGNKSSPSDRFSYSDNLIPGKQYSPFNGIFNADQNGFKTDGNSSTDKFTIKLDKTYNTKDLYALVVYHMRSYGGSSGKQYVKLKKDGIDVEEVAYHDLPTATGDELGYEKSYKVKFGQYDNYKDGFSDNPSNDKIINDGTEFTMINPQQMHTVTTIDKISLEKEFNEIECQVKGRYSWVGELQLWAPNEVSLISKNDSNEYVTNATYDNSLGNRVMGAQSVAYNGSGLAFIANEYKILLRDITRGLNPHKKDTGSLYDSIHNVLHNWELYQEPFNLEEYTVLINHSEDKEISFYRNNLANILNKIPGTYFNNKSIWIGKPMAQELEKNMYLEIEVNGELKKFNVFPSTKMDTLQRTYVYLKTEPEFLPTTYSRYYKVRFYKKRNTDKVYEVQKQNNYLQTPLPILLDYPVKAKHFKIIVEDGEFDESELELKIFNGSHSESQKANNFNVNGNKISFTEEKILLGIRSSKINKLKFQYSNDGTNFKTVKNVEVPKINLSCSSLLNTSYNFGDISLNESKISQILGIGLPNYESGKGKVMAYIFFYKKFGNTYMPRKLELTPYKGSVDDNFGRLIKVSSDGSKLIASANYYISIFSLSNDYSKFELLENINLSEFTSLINNISISGNGRFLTYSAEDTDQVQLWEDKTSTKREYEEIPGYRDISSSFSTIKRINSNFLEFNALNFTASNIMDNNNDYGPEGLRSSDLSTYLGNIWIAGKARTGVYNRGIAQNNRLGNNRDKGEYVRVDFGIPFKMTKFEVFGHDHIGAHQNPKNLTIYASNESYEDNNNVDLQKVFAKTNINNKLIFGSESVNGKKILITSQDEYRYYYFVFGDIQVISTHPHDAFCVKVRHLKFYDHQGKVYKNFKFYISDKITKDYNADDEEYEYYQTGEIYYNDNKANFWYHGKKGIIYLNSNKSDNNLLADQ